MLLYGEGNGNSLQYPCLDNLLDKYPVGLQSIIRKESAMTEQVTQIHNVPIISYSHFIHFQFYFCLGEFAFTPLEIYLYLSVDCLCLTTYWGVGWSWANLPCICFTLLPFMYPLNLLICCLICMGFYVFHFLSFTLNQTCQFLDIQSSSVQALSHVQLFAAPWAAARQTSLSTTNSQSLLDSCPLSRWCHSTISSSAIPSSSRLQSFPASGSFPLSQFSASGSQSIGV